MDTDTDTDTDNLTERFREIRQDWDLQAAEAETQAQNKALVLLHEWLKTGVDSPEVVIRAVQVLMTDPEQPAVHKRPAVKQVIKPIAQAWASAGLKEQDVSLLRAMLLAAWPKDLNGGSFKLVPLLASAWSAIQSRLGREKHLEDWRVRVAEYTQTEVAIDWSAPPLEVKEDKNRQSIKVASQEKAITALAESGGPYSQAVAHSSAAVLREHEKSIALLKDTANAASKEMNRIGEELSMLSGETQKISRIMTLLHPRKENLMWWGQSRYSTSLRTPYRRVGDATERLWWMAWESSALSRGLDVEPAASFFVETLYHVEQNIDERKRPLKQWLAELTGMLRAVHASERHEEKLSMSTRLSEIAKVDKLGLPITWARLEARRSKPSEASIEQRIREDVGVDPETSLDLADWASWIFRESLLDHHLGAQ